MEKGSKIYIAGHTGLVGSALVRCLQRHGYSNLITAPAETLDLRRQSDTERFIGDARPDYIFLAAARVGGILANSTYTAEFIYDNLMIAANVIHAAHLAGVKKLLNLGSSCIYPRLAAQPLKEEALLTGLLEPTNEPYAMAKIAAIKLCRYYNEQYGTNYVSVMPTNLYGPGDNFNLETAHVLPALMRKLHLAKLLRQRRFDLIRADIKRHDLGFGLDKEAVSAGDQGLEQLLRNIGIESDRAFIWGGGNIHREFLYVDDLAEACIFLMERYGYPEIRDFINIGSGADMLIKDIAILLQGIIGFEGSLVFDTSKPSGTPRKLLDSSRINRLGWKPTVSLNDGINKEYSWYLGHKN